MIEGIQSEEIDALWPQVVFLVDRAMGYIDGKMSSEDVYKALKNKKMQLWLVPGGIWVTQIEQYPRSKRLEWVAAAGEYNDWTEYLPILFEWAESQGCDAVEIVGRPGWGRKTGFEEIHRVFRVKLPWQKAQDKA